MDVPKFHTGARIRVCSAEDMRELAKERALLAAQHGLLDLNVNDEDQEKLREAASIFVDSDIDHSEVKALALRRGRIVSGPDMDGEYLVRLDKCADACEEELSIPFEALTIDFLDKPSTTAKSPVKEPWGDLNKNESETIHYSQHGETFRSRSEAEAKEIRLGGNWEENEISVARNALRGVEQASKKFSVQSNASWDEKKATLDGLRKLLLYCSLNVGKLGDRELWRALEDADKVQIPHGNIIFDYLTKIKSELKRRGANKSQAKASKKLRSIELEWNNGAAARDTAPDLVRHDDKNVIDLSDKMRPRELL